MPMHENFRRAIGAVLRSSPLTVVSHTSHPMTRDSDAFTRIIDAPRDIGVGGAGPSPSAWRWSAWGPHQFTNPV